MASSAPSSPRGTRLTTRVVVLVVASHPGPTVAVTALAGLFAIAVGLDGGGVLLVMAAVLTGQLTIGWTNDLIDAGRDRQVGRPDKPLATGELSVDAVRLAVLVAVVATVPLSLASGIVAGLVQLMCTAAGWAYNAGLKSTVWSWVPYAVAFGGLPVYVSLAHDSSSLPPPWVPLSGALLGVGAHLVNVLPDLEDDAATGVRGLPHRLGVGRTAPVAVVVLVLASVVIAAGAPVRSPWATAVSLAAVLGLGVVALVRGGRTPFRAAIGVALVDVVMLVWSQGGS